MQKLKYKPPIPVQDLTLIYPIYAGWRKLFINKQQALELTNEHGYAESISADF